MDEYVVALTMVTTMLVMWLAMIVIIVAMKTHTTTMMISVEVVLLTVVRMAPVMKIGCWRSRYWRWLTA